LSVGGLVVKSPGSTRKNGGVAGHRTNANGQQQCGHCPVRLF
jgi:hypothetical protein